jgi:hypothetical protein
MLPTNGMKCTRLNTKGTVWQLGCSRLQRRHVGNALVEMTKVRQENADIASRRYA